MTEEQDKLFLDNMKLVNKVANKYYRYFTFMDKEDIIQNGFIGLVNACMTYNSNKGAFSTYAYKCIENVYKLDIQNYYYRYKNRLLNPFLADMWSLDKSVLTMDEQDDMYTIVPSYAFENGSNVIDRITAEWIICIAPQIIRSIDKTTDALYTINMEVFNSYYILGMSQANIARKLNITRISVGQRLKVISKYIRRAIGVEGKPYVEL